MAFQEYTEEFREIAPRNKKYQAGVADGNITLINQRSVCDDLPVRLDLFLILLFYVLYLFPTLICPLKM